MTSLILGIDHLMETISADIKEVFVFLQRWYNDVPQSDRSQRFAQEGSKKSKKPRWALINFHLSHSLIFSLNIEFKICKIWIEWSLGILKARCRHRSVDLSAPTILPPWVCVPSTQSTLFHLCYICHVKGMKINKKRPGLAQFFLKKRCCWTIFTRIGKK